MEQKNTSGKGLTFLLLVAAFCAHTMGFPGGPVCKESTCNVGDLGLITGLGRSLEKSMHRGAWHPLASVHGITKSQT